MAIGHVHALLERRVVTPGSACRRTRAFEGSSSSSRNWWQPRRHYRRWPPRGRRRRLDGAPNPHDRVGSLAVMATYLLVVGDREALGWVLRSGKMAFPATHRPEIDQLAPGDRLLKYATRGCFRNPGRDRGRVIGESVVLSRVRDLDAPRTFTGRTFPHGCQLRHESLSPFGLGVELASAVHELEAFGGAGKGWPMRLRKPLVKLTERDALMLHERLAGVAARPPRATDVATYARWFDEAVSEERRPAGSASDTI